MRQQFASFALLSFLLLFSYDASAGVLSEEAKIKPYGYVEDMDSATIYSTFLRNAPEDFQTPGFPAVAVVGKEGKFVFGVGGFVKVVTGWDIGHPLPSPDEFITGEIPMENMDGDNSRFNLSAMQTHLFLNFVALPGTANEIGTFISANLLNNYLPTLQFAYIKYRGFQAGYDYSLFSDPGCSPTTVDYEGPCSSTSNQVAGISYEWMPGRSGRWTLGIGVELPEASFTTVEELSRQVYQRVPNIPLEARYSWDEDASWVRLSAIGRCLTYRDVAASTNRNCFGYGFQASGAWNFLDRFTLYYQGIWGKGIASSIQDTVDEGLDMTPVADDTRLAPVMIWGGFASLECAVTDRLSASATYSHLRSYAKEYTDGSTDWADLYKYAQYVSANTFYSVTSYFNIGLEYIWGRRTNYSGLKCADTRIQAAFQLTF